MTFIGWSSDGGTTLLDADGVKAIAVTGNITYTAYYEKEEYTVTYDAGAHGALVGGATDSVLYNEYPDYVPGITEDTGYDFIGWSSDGGTTLLDADGVKGDRGDGQYHVHGVLRERRIHGHIMMPGAHGALVGGATDSVLYNEYPDYVPGITEDHGI